MVNPIALRTAKTLWSFGCSECNRVKWFVELPECGGDFNEIPLCIMYIHLKYFSSSAAPH